MRAFVIAIVFCFACASHGRRKKFAVDHEASFARVQEASRPQRSPMAAMVTMLMAYNPAASFSLAALGRARAVQATHSNAVIQRSTNVDMLQAMSRRSILNTLAAAAAAAPFAAVADGGSTVAARERAREIYGPRVFSLVSASNEKIIEEADALMLFASEASTSSTKGTLKTLGNKAVASAKAGNNAAAQETIKRFVSVGKIVAPEPVVTTTPEPEVKEAKKVASSKKTVRGVSAKRADKSAEQKKLKEPVDVRENSVKVEAQQPASIPKPSIAIPKASPTLPDFGKGSASDKGFDPINGLYAGVAAGLIPAAALVGGARFIESQGK